MYGSACECGGQYDAAPGHVAGGAGAALRDCVPRAGGHQCARCWPHGPQPASQARHPRALDDTHGRYPR